MPISAATERDGKRIGGWSTLFLALPMTSIDSLLSGAIDHGKYGTTIRSIVRWSLSIEPDWANTDCPPLFGIYLIGFLKINRTFNARAVKERIWRESLEKTAVGYICLGSGIEF